MGQCLFFFVSDSVRDLRLGGKKIEGINPLKQLCVAIALRVLYSDVVQWVVREVGLCRKKGERGNNRGKSGGFLGALKIMHEQ